MDQDEALELAAAGVALVAALEADDAAAAMEDLAQGGAELRRLGTTPVEKACYFDAAACLAAMIEAGEDWTADGDGVGGLEMAVRFGAEKCFRELESRADGLSRERLGQAIGAAFEERRPDWAMRILEWVEPLDWAAPWAGFALDGALRRRGEGLAGLLGRGCPPGRELEGSPMLEVASKRGCWAAVEALLDVGGRPGAKDLDSMLREAAQAGAFEAMRTLLALGANPNAYDEAGRNAFARLMDGNSYGCVKGLEILLAAGADPRASVNGWGWGSHGDVLDSLCGAKSDPEAVAALCRFVDPRPKLRAIHKVGYLPPAMLHVLQEAAKGWNLREEAEREAEAIAMGLSGQLPELAVGKSSQARL